MNEGPPQAQDNNEDLVKKAYQMYAEVLVNTYAKEEKILRAYELFLNGEVFPFTGIKLATYNRIKTDQEEEIELMGQTVCTPIDELLERYENEGLKVVLGKNPESGNVFVLPRDSDDIVNDSFLLSTLSLDGDIDQRLFDLINETITLK